MRRLFSLISVALLSWCAVSAQRHVSQERMAEVYKEARTPYKYGLVVAPTDNNHKIDCPTVFREGDKWYMTYVVYNGRSGQDGRGYETWLAESDNLLEWTTLGRILAYSDTGWDRNQRGGFPGLIDMEWGGSYAINRYKGKCWMTYIGGEGTGYEAVNAPLAVGLAWTKGSPATAHLWETLDHPIISITDKDVQWWEALTEYKSTVYEDPGKTLGSRFMMYYNAGGVNPETGMKGERIGIALSDNMTKWRRYEGNPVFTHEAQGTITGDAQIVKMGDVYVMFYFSAFNPSRSYKAFNTFACSYDLVTWDDWEGSDLIYPTKEFDELFAHKSYLVKHDGVVYHFYCAVNNAEQRGIAVATSKPMGRSSVKFPARPATGRRGHVSLNEGWTTWLNDDKTTAQKVNVPHNWDDYYGYRQLTHGNLHGNAGYVRDFSMAERVDGKRYFINFEGVGTYANIKLNGHDLGRHPSGRTSLTFDVTDYLNFNGENTLEVLAEHPEMIADMPWVCGGCSSEWGFSEGSQPLGIFRPVELEITDEVRVEPFGVHIWNNAACDSVFIETELKNYGSKAAEFDFINKFSNADGRQIFRLTDKLTLQPGESKVIKQASAVTDVHRWGPDDPYLYKLSTMVKRDGKTTEEVTTPYGIRNFSWPVKRNDGDGRFFMNGEPVFINGVCEYEHQFGASHAFSDEQIAARVKQIKNSGFNSVRDAHQPHNLRYQEYWDKEGILFWPQFSAHIWYDTPEFRENFKTLLRQWVKERRNSPSVVMWGLQNESTLPRDFAQECSEIIREMDPMARDMRVITTCNGGEGTDWNVIQNWSGTYGGDVYKYNEELSRPNQLLNGEYGAWRTLGFHTEPGEFDPNGPWSEERMTQLMETKVRLAEQAKDSVSGHYQWIFSSHDNPGRRQPDEAYRMIDKVGPFNYKGLVSPWEEPADVYYMYKSNYTDAATDPFVYIASHSWPDRFKGPRKATIEVYSNCDSVILYNDALEANYLGSREKGGIGTHFEWKDADIRCNVLRAVGYYNGEPVAEDVIVLENLETAPNFDALRSPGSTALKGVDDYNYVYRINCGGDEYTDEFNQTWLADDTIYSRSWAQDFTGLSPYLASQRVTYDPIAGTNDWNLLQSFRFGRHKLSYRLPLSNGRYRVELYFIEPWHGTGGGEGTDCEGLRIFDVAINDSTVIDDLDIWAEAGHDKLLKKMVDCDVTDGYLNITFPEVKAGQAVLSAIAVASLDPSAKALAPKHVSTWSWKAADRDVMEKMPADMLPKDENARAAVTYEAEDAKLEGKYDVKDFKKQIGVFFSGKGSVEWTISTGLAQVYALRFKFMNTNKDAKAVNLKLIAPNGAVLKDDTINLPDTPDKWRMLSTTTGGYINAGTYKVIISSPDLGGVAFDSLEVQ
ncbi:MAG: malectin domain-containing carbohydrate-binding protein [Bacteroides sp.]|nr:malectin domain-containing carbohydrate-binding protein [Bacteroides sp.]